MAVTVTLYKSNLCPRCHLTKRYLHEITKDNPEIHIEEIDILKEPGRTWKEGIRMIPALKINNHIISALFLNKNAISTFLNQYTA